MAPAQKKYDKAKADDIVPIQSGLDLPLMDAGSARPGTTFTRSTS